MKSIALLIILLATSLPAFAIQQSSNELVAKMKLRLDLSDDQVYNITPVIDKYNMAIRDLQKSIDEGTINSSAIDSQIRGIEDEETQEISQYLKPYQLSEWRNMQAELHRINREKNYQNTSDEDYTNLPRNYISE